MNSSDKRLLRACLGMSIDRIPFWFMRQAGRYIPEYRKLRSETKDFLTFCYTPEKAAEATLQPIRRFGMDGAIIFSDILVVPHALGMDVRFEEGHGPVLKPVREIKNLNPKHLKEKLSPVYEALRLTKKQLPDETALIGFAGAPWTLACYMIEGKSSKDFASLKQAAKDEEFFPALMELLVESVSEHLIAQVEAGAEILQLFDSWAGIADASEYEKWIIAPAKKIIANVKKSCPEIPIIAFPRQSGEKFLAYARQVKPDAISVDASVSLEWIKSQLQPHVVVQGLLNQALLASDKAAMLAEAKKILTTLDKPFVFNLSHGILPATPPEHMQALCQFLKSR